MSGLTREIGAAQTVALISVRRDPSAQALSGDIIRWDPLSASTIWRMCVAHLIVSWQMPWCTEQELPSGASLAADAPQNGDPPGRPPRAASAPASARARKLRAQPLEAVPLGEVQRPPAIGALRQRVGPRRAEAPGGLRVLAGALGPGAGPLLAEGREVAEERAPALVVYHAGITACIKQQLQAPQVRLRRALEVDQAFCGCMQEALPRPLSPQLDDIPVLGRGCQSLQGAGLPCKGSEEEDLARDRGASPQQRLQRLDAVVERRPGQRRPAQRVGNVDFCPGSQQQLTDLARAARRSEHQRCCTELVGLARGTGP
mmetsp:Transcript_97135/g.274733  ORF Transcript_97135/g.274733 Transcript_97135/m.274733 type:complete len:316 (-) Transcript_97135:91-1038(-)